jgi:DNA-binding response OmpR family regulator
VRATFGRKVYILILTARTESDDLVTAVQAGADDYVTKPFKSQELRVRLAAACRILRLEEQLAAARCLGPAVMPEPPSGWPDASGGVA